MNELFWIILPVVYLFACYLYGRHRKQKQLEVDNLPTAIGNMTPAKHRNYAMDKRDRLSDVLLEFTPRDPFTVRDLNRSVLILGAAGSGKTSGSGFHLAKALASHPNIGGLILASKPEEFEMFDRIFRQAGRRKFLVNFSPDEWPRCNYLDFIYDRGGDSKDVAHFLKVCSETMSTGSENRDKFWSDQEQRWFGHAITIVGLGMGKVAAPDLDTFISAGAMTPAAVNTPEYKNSFQGQCLRAAYNNVKTDIEKNDFGLAFRAWKNEWPAMADKMRSGILTGMKRTLDVFNTGIVRELISTTTNVTPLAMDDGYWIMMNMPISTYGKSGEFILAGMKYLTQRYILHRRDRENLASTVIWTDEYQKVANSFDPEFLAECRSHKGCMVCLTQSIHSIYTRIQEAQEHGADALMTNFYTKLIHALGDDKTASYASSLIGKRLKTRVNTSMAPTEGGAWGAIYGESKISTSTHQSIEDIIQAREFMHGLRTGGHEHGYQVDGIVVRSGQPFSTGENYLKVAFDQRG